VYLQKNGEKEEYAAVARTIVQAHDQKDKRKKRNQEVGGPGKKRRWTEEKGSQRLSAAGRLLQSWCD